MKIEGKEMNAANISSSTTTSPENDERSTTTATNDVSSTSSTTDSLKRVKQVDRFYAEQINARTSNSSNTGGGGGGGLLGSHHERMLDNDISLTYLEKKGIYWRNVHCVSKGIAIETNINNRNVTRQRRAREHNNLLPHQQNNRQPHGPIPAVPQGLNEVELFAFFDNDDEGFADQGHFIGVPENMFGQPQHNRELPLPFDFGRRPGFMPPSIQPSSSRESQGSSGASSKILNSKTKGLKLPVKCHRHLLNRHVQRFRAVNDEKGEMNSREISMSANFFYPIDQKNECKISYDRFMHRRIIKQVRNDNAKFTEHEVVSNLDLQVYSYETVNLINDKSKRYSLEMKGGSHSQMASLRELVDHYETMLLSFLQSNDYYGFNECMLDFWDVFFPVTTTVHFYDRFTPVPRMSYKQRFLCRPCPKAFGTVQCEIERIKVHKKSRGVNVTSRIFPTYEYR